MNFYTENWILLITIPLAILNIACFGALIRAGIRQKGFYQFSAGWMLLMLILGIVLQMAKY